jgi:CBS domain-containing protein
MMAHRRMARPRRGGPSGFEMINGMPKTRVDEVDGVTVAAVMHAQFSTLPATATVGDVRDWFAQSTSRRMAFVADGERYAGSLTPAQLADDVDPSRPAVELVQEGPTVSPDAPATSGRDLALATDSRRVPVVDGDGRLLGVVAVTSDLQSFCGTG